MTTTSTDVTSAPRWKTIRDELRSLLAQQDYGSTFLSIAEICKRFEVSTITARRVLSELENEGHVEKIRGKGTVVRRVSQQVCIRLVVPSSVRRDYMSHSAIMRRIISGASDLTRQNQVDFDTTNEDLLQRLFDNRHDNVGLLLPQGVSRDTIHFIRKRHLPHVFLSPLENLARRVPHVLPDRYQAGYLGTQHLIDLGHRRIAYVLGPIRYRNFRDRVRGYRDALKANGIGFSWALIHETDGKHIDEDEKALDELLALRQPPTAILCGDDDYRAIHLLESLAKRGIKVPQQMSLLGYPNCPDSRLTHPPLSVVDGCYEEVGAQSIKLLLAQMLSSADEQAQAGKERVKIQPKIVSRESTAAPQAEPKADPSTDAPSSDSSQ